MNVKDLGRRFRAEFGARVIATALGSLLTVILARLLNPDGYGVLFLAITCFNIASIFSRLGIARSAARYIAEYKEKDPSQIPHIISYSLLLNILTSVIVGGIFFFGDSTIAVLLEDPKLSELFTFGPFFIISNTMVYYSRTIFQGFEDINRAASIMVLERVIKFGAIISLILLGYGIIGAIIGYVIGYFCSSAFGLGYLYYTYYRKYQIANVVEKDLRKKIIEYSIPVTLTNSASKIDKQVDVLIVGFLLNPAAVGFYTLGKQLMQFISVPVSALGFAISPTLGNKKASGNLSEGASIYKASLSNALLLYLPASAGLFLLAEPSIRIIFGKEYLGAVPILQVFSIYIVFRSVTHVTSNGLDYLGRAKARAITKLITSVLNAILTVVMVIQFGVVGAAISTVITFFIYTAVVFYIVWSEFRFGVVDLIKRVIKISAVTLTMAILIFYFSQYVNNIYSLTFVVAFGICFFMIGCISTGILKVTSLKQMVGALIT